MTRRILSRTALVGGWAVAVGMSGVALIRMLRSDSQPQLIGIQGIGLWLLLPAYPLALAAAVTRQRSLAAVAVVLAIGNVVWVSEAYESGQPATAAAGTFTLRVVTANMLLTNSDVEGLAHDLAATGADLLVLQEFTPEHLADITHAGLLIDYPHQILDATPGFHGSAILSKLPIISGGAFDQAGSPMTRADIATAAGTVALVNVHPVAPINESQARRWRAQLDLLAQVSMSVSGPLIMAGDFNATKDHRPMQALLSSGMRDAYSDAAGGIGATWPQWEGPVFPVMRLDHVLVNDGITVLRAEVQDNRGSDHRRLAVDLSLPRTRARHRHRSPGDGPVDSGFNLITDAVRMHAIGFGASSSDDREALLLRSNVSGGIGGRDNDGVPAGCEALRRDRPGPRRRHDDLVSDLVHDNLHRAPGRHIHSSADRRGGCLGRHH